MKTTLKYCLLFFVLIVSACHPASRRKADKAFSAYIAAFTSGTISREGTVRVRLINDVPDDIRQAAAEKLFDFSPGMPGQVVWTDSRTAEFRPASAMKPGQVYRSTFLLGNVMKVPSRFKEFEFDFQVMDQSFEVNVDGLRPLDNAHFDRQVLTGSVATADVEEPKRAEGVLTATQDGRKLPLRWEHASGKTTHNFYVDSILRGKDSSVVVLSWDGKSIDVNRQGFRNVTVPALGDFLLMNSRIEQDEEQPYVVLEFSDPLLENQDLKGLITLGGRTDMRFVTEGNTVRIYPSSRESNMITLEVSGGIRNTLGRTLDKDAHINLLFAEMKPGLRLLGKGVILPGPDGLMLPFESVGLSAVDVRVVKIFDDNVAQFLQVNDLNGENELTRVGRVVLKKTIPLSRLKQTDFSKWNSFTLDLGDLVKTDPGAIYRVTLSFKKKYSLYACQDAEAPTAKEENMEEFSENWDDSQQKEASSWDYVEEYYDEDGEYRWNDRDDPCKNSYYTASRWVSRNVLASNLGLVAKKGVEGSMLFAVTDLKTTQPQAGVTLEVYNYQHVLLAKKETGTNGLAELSLEQKPFLLIAKKGDQRGYLKLDDGSSLSLSMFDVSGEKVQKGIKGFIYGERGVWRPGDSLYVMFILEDKQHTLPDVHPVTFELYNPMGQLSKKMTRSESMDGFYAFHTATDEEAPTGNWEARVKVGSAVFTKTIRIETIMPNRLKIKFDFAEKALQKDEPASAVMEVKWLHGAIARNLKADVEVSLTSARTTFPKFSEFTFDDPTRKFSADKQQIFDGTVDANGRATVKADLEAGDAAPGMLQANFVTKVFEPGGNFSVDRFSIPFHPYDNYVGLLLPKGDKARGMLLTDTNHLVQLAVVDQNGNLAKGRRKLEIEFYQVQWKWWWDKSDEDLTDYASSRFNNLKQRDTVTAVNGRAEWKLRLNFPDWGRYLLRVRDTESGHVSGKTFYMDWPGWAGRGQREQPGSATMLTFTTDKDNYKVGEQAVLTIPSGKNSRALISIENGSRVVKTYWAEGKEGSIVYNFPITADMTPNVYVHVTLLQPHAQTVNDLPIRMYGIMPIGVENADTHIQPVLSMPAVLKPEAPVNFTVAEQRGKPMTYTVAVVDEGLLDITRFKTPDPWDHFYAREAIGVKTWDMYDFVVGAWGTQLQRILSIGGDEGLEKPKEGKKANRFKPVVKFLGPFHLAAGEKKSHSFMMPQYVGSVRTMVIAGNNGAYGFTEKATPVRTPLMVLGTLPRVLGPDETVDLPVTVFAMEKNVKDVQVKISVNNAVSVEGEAVQTIRFAQPGDDVVNFRLKVKPFLGVARVKITASSGKESAETNIEMNVRIPNPRVTEVRDTVLEPGQVWNTAYKTVGMAGTNSGLLEVSSIPPLNLGKRLEYLVHYPYGCVEQTTSSVFPQLFLSDLMELPPAKKAAIEKNIKAGIDRLRLFQTASGGISYWPGESAPDEWASNYAGHYLLEAERKGYSLPPGYIEQWKKYQQGKAASYQPNANPYTHPHGRESYELMQAYRLYTLALAKSPDLASMNRMRENKNLSMTSRWCLASAYMMAGQPEVARQLTDRLPTVVNDYKELGATYGSDERDEALILETLSLMGRRDRATPLMKMMSASLCSKDWMSTQTTAYMLMAMSKYVGNSSTNKEFSFSYQVNGSTEQFVSSKAPVSQSDLKVRGTAPGHLQLKNSGQGMLYARIIMEGIPKTGDPVSSESDLNMTVIYKEQDGHPLDPSKIRQGTDFYAEVTVTNPGLRGQYEQMALNQVFPSGWEILNTRLDGTSASSGTSVPRYQDIRDDRVYTYYDLKPKETKTFRVYLNASYAGTYYLPTVYSEAMYDASISSRKAGMWVTVTRDQPAGSSESASR